MSILAIISGVLKFWDEVVWFLKKLEKTPTEKIAGVLSSIDNGFKEAEKDDDTSEIENIIRRG